MDDFYIFLYNYSYYIPSCFFRIVMVIPDICANLRIKKWQQPCINLIHLTCSATLVIGTPHSKSLVGVFPPSIAVHERTQITVRQLKKWVCLKNKVNRLNGISMVPDWTCCGVVF